jgi:hypothetical protein
LARTRAVGAACALGGFLLLGVALAPSLAGRQAFLPADYWLGTVPFAFAQPPAWRAFRSNALLGDPAILYPPQLWVLRAALAEGHVALWNRFARGGEATLGSGQVGPLAPTTWPILAAPWPLGFAWAAWLRFGLLWCGAYLFARALALPRAAALAVAAGFCCAPLFAVHFQQLPRATAHVALPWLLLAAERVASAAGSGMRGAVWAALPLAAWAGFACVAGYPPAALTVLFGAALYAAIRAPWRPLERALGVRAIAALALVAGMALAAPALLPFEAALRDSATLGDREAGGAWTLPIAALRMLWDPFAFGSPLAGAARAWSGPENFEEAQQYVGLLPWALLLAFAPALRSTGSGEGLRAAALAALVLVAASLAFGWWPLHPLLTLVPPFSVNANPRLLFLAQTALAALAALACAAWLRDRGDRARSTWFRIAAPLALAGAAALVAIAIDAAARPWLAAASAIAVVATLRTAATHAERRTALVLVPLVWLADVGPPYAALHPRVPAGWADPARAVAQLPEPIAGDPAPRVAFERFTPPNLPALFGVEDVRAYSFPSPLRYDRYALDVMGIEIPINLLRDDLARERVVAGLERTCAGWLWTTQRYAGTPIAARVEPVWERAERIFLYRLLRASPCAAWWDDAAVERAPDLDAAVARLAASLGEPVERIVVEADRTTSSGVTPSAGIATPLRWDGPNRIALDVPAGARGRAGWLVVRVSHDRGWRAASDAGTPLRIVPSQVRFLAVEVPAGTGRVELVYTPPRWRLAWSLAGGALALLAVSAAWSRRG